MSKEKQILQLHADGTSNRQIATILSVSRNRITSVVDVAKRSGMTLPELLRLDEATIKSCRASQVLYHLSEN